MLDEVTEALLDYLRGNRIAKEQINERREICNACEFKAKLILSYCTVCNCKLEGELGALSAPRKKCPKGKWAVKEETNE